MKNDDKYIREPHDCAPAIEKLVNIQAEFLNNKNRTEEDQKRFEAVSYQIENYREYYKKSTEE